MTSNSRHVWEAPRGRGALGRRRLPTGATAKVQLARRAASPCEDARDLGEEGGKTRARGKELSGVLRVFPFFLFLTFLCLCFNGSHQSSGRLGQPRRPTEAHKPKPEPTTVCHGVPGAATLFNTGTQNNHRGREICSPCLSVDKKQMQKITQHDIAYNGNSFIRQKPVLPSHEARLNLWNFHLRHVGALWLCVLMAFTLAYIPAKRKGLGCRFSSWVDLHS